MAYQSTSVIIRDALAKAAHELPPLPNVLMRVLQLTQDNSSSTVAEIEKLIRSDQAISSKLLRVVNSSYFGLSGQVSSVSQAVMILGYQQVRNLVLSVSMMAQFSSISEEAKDAQSRCWEVAFGTASAAQLIAKKKRFDVRDAELAFVAGLLQNLGSLFMLSAAPQAYLSVLEETENTKAWLFDVENVRLSTNHAEVGKFLMVKWKLPEDLILTVGRHEGPFAGDPIPGLYAVHAGEHLVYHALHGERPPAAMLGIDPLVLEWLDWSDEEYAWAMDEVKSKIDQAIDLIGGLKA